jgi:hypothetical protein
MDWTMILASSMAVNRSIIMLYARLQLDNRNRQRENIDAYSRYFR